MTMVMMYMHEQVCVRVLFDGNRLQLPKSNIVSSLQVHQIGTGGRYNGMTHHYSSTNTGIILLRDLQG